MIKKCVNFFIYTRSFYILLIISIYSTRLLEKYDLSTELLNYNENSNEEGSFIERIISKFFSYFSSYDAIHFIIIAKKGYINDNIFAFFPLYTLLTRGLSSFLSLILPFKNEFLPYMISGFIISNLSCFINTLLLFSLIYKLTNSQLKAQISVLLYLINPGTIFYISIYSENLYLTLQLIFIHYLIKSAEEKYSQLNVQVSLGNKPSPKRSYFLELACLIIGLLTTRSNSITLCSFFVIPCFLIIFYKEKYIDSFSEDSGKFLFNLGQFFKYFQKVYKEIGIYVILCFHSFLCFIYMTKFKPKEEICFYIKKGINKNLTKYDLFSNWCNYPKQSKINSFYSYIQTEYWNVGFLKQYSLNTIDRLILALPMNICAMYILYKLFFYFDFMSLIKNFNIRSFMLKNTMEIRLILDKDENEPKENIDKSFYKKKLILNSFIFGSGVSFFALFFVLAFIAHPQINNRLLSGCPIFYLFLIEDVIDFLKNNYNGHYWRGFSILLFFITISILGCIMQVGSYGFA